MRVTITLKASAKIDDVIRQTKANGFSLEKSLPILGMLIGDVSEQDLTALRAIDGVEAVDPEEQIRTTSM